MIPESDEEVRFHSKLLFLEPKETLGSLIDTIEFNVFRPIPQKKKTKMKSSYSVSETDSISSNQSYDSKEKSKVWSEEEMDLFKILLKKYGTDFHILSAFFPKKTKNQLKVPFP